MVVFNQICYDKPTFKRYKHGKEGKNQRHLDSEYSNEHYQLKSFITGYNFVYNYTINNVYFLISMSSETLLSIIQAKTQLPIFCTMECSLDDLSTIFTINTFVSLVREKVGEHNCYSTSVPKSSRLVTEAGMFLVQQ